MDAVIDDEERKALLEEFKEAGHLHRLHVGLMFGQITVFLGASGAIAHRIASNPPLEPVALRLFALFGCFLALLFIVLHERVYAYSYGARQRAQEIQGKLGLSLYHDQQTHFRILRGCRARWVTRSLYIIIFLFWVWVAFITPSFLKIEPPARGISPSRTSALL